MHLESMPLGGKIFFFWFLVLGVWLVAYGQQPTVRSPITVKTHQREGYQDIEIQTALTNYLFSTQGAVLKSAYLYFAPFGWQPLELIPDTATDPKTLSRSFLEDAGFPFAILGGAIGEKEPYEFEMPPTDRAKQLVLIFRKQLAGFTIQKRFTIYNDPYYTLKVELALKNSSDSPITSEDDFRMVLGNGVGGLGKWEARYLFDGKRSAVLLGPEAYKQFNGLGFVSRDLVFFLKNESPQIRPFVAAGGKLFGVKAERLILAAGEERTFQFTLYAGRHKYLLLEHAGFAGIENLSLYNQLLVPMIRFLDWLYQKTRNYGWAIIIFTLITRIVLFPLMRKQFYSMAKMHQLRDRIEKLQQRYPNLLKLRQLHPKMSEDELRRRARENQQALHQKLMELYKKEGINPLSGCLPMLIQFPILIILWRTIMYSAERIHLSPGFLWMPDLSFHDPYYIIVVLTVIFMVLQSKLTPTPTPSAGGLQTQLFIWGMPIFMGILLKDFPAGLWLYYFLTTALQVLQQLFINWEMSRKAPKPQEVGVAE